MITLQQITGQPSVLYYANEIFSQAGLGSVQTLGVGLFKLLATLGSALMVEKYGRRPLLMVGCSLMLFALVALTCSFAWQVGGRVGISEVTVIVAMFIYVGGYQVGFGPICWLLIAEIFPLEVRGQAVALSVLANFFWNLVVSLVFEAEISALGAATTFGLFAAIDALAIFFIASQVPETKGLSLEDIERMFASGNCRNAETDPHANESTNT